MSKKFKVGVIGYGWVAGAHIAALQATGKAEVVAVQSARALDSAELQAKHGTAIRPYPSVKELLAHPGLDTVSICSYPNLHAQQVIEAAQAGKHIIVEKPLAFSVAELRAVEKAVKAAGVTFCICFECRYSSQFLATKSLIDSGLLGTLHYGEVDYYHGIGPWYGQFRWNVKKELGGSSLLSAGCHALDALLLCMGDDVESVTSMASSSKAATFDGYEYPTTSVTLVRFASGKVGKVASVIDCIQPYYFHTHLVGSEGSLLDNKFHSTKLGLNKNAWSELSMKMLDSGDVSDHPYQKQFEVFFEALEQGKPMPLTGLAEAVRTHEVIFAAERSIETRVPVSLRDLHAS